MPVPSTINDLSTTAGSNSPAGSESPALIDDYLRAHGSFIATLRDEKVSKTGDETIAGTKTFNSNPAISAGTTNGVLYLNGSKAVTSGSGLVFDGNNLGLGVTPSAWGGSYRAVEVGTGALYDQQGTETSVSFNAYKDSAGQWRYSGKGGNATAVRLGMAFGQFTFNTAPSGTAGNPISFTQAMTLGASGNLGVGTANPQYKAHVSSNDGGVDSWVGSQNATATTTIGAGFIAVAGASSYYSTFKQRANGDAEVFHCNPIGSLLFATGAVERARIDSGGNLLVGTTAMAGDVSSSGFRVAPAGKTISTVDGDTTQNLVLASFNSTGPRSAVEFYRNGYVVGSIATSSGGTSYNTSSDYRLKHDIAPMQNALQRVAALKPCTYKWNADNSDGEGFIAHELATVCPQAVTGEKDAVDADGKPVYQGIDTSFLVATLTAAIQEQQAIITELRSRIEALEAK
ncbi:tail fiber domain-containing protein [Pseudomonas sp.]|uniref:tail fiber domain-containing protein n=1 Tax=Pseudomonas sp. TaxID=306 RepID=UPI00258357BC|nr:tail fiber domain-containing protein [Pseudomonas sp.]